MKMRAPMDLDADRPKLGTWPNFEPGCAKPSQCLAPEPSYEVCALAWL